LVRAFINLRLKPNKDLLSDLINKANGLNRADYTSASLKAIDDVMEKANAVLNNPEATKEEVETAVSALTKALAGLGANPVKQGDKTVSIKTGDETSLGMLMSLAGLSLLSFIGYVSIKRKED
ncbi:FIVAR domain-containing protein, partial [Thomasclavelia cocleata]